MRLFTVEINKKEEILIETHEGCGYLLRDLGFHYNDMNEIICKMTSEEFLRLKETVGKVELKSQIKSVLLSDVKILAPIVNPMQDIICLGINYDEHAVEAGSFSEEAFGGERPYTIYFSKRVNRATATGEEIP